jgi:4-amino-4-deoxy-L-arabinose transferase-like glycosyltransferase
MTELPLNSRSSLNSLTLPKRWTLAICSFLFIGNIAFKLIHISSAPLWYDEIISVMDTQLDFGHIKHEAEWDKNPPFYHYLLWCWSKFFGISEVGVRSMSVFFNALCSVVIFLFASRISGYFNGLAAAVLFSVHPTFFYYSQEARCFMLLAFLVLVDLWLVYRYFVRPDTVTALFLGVLTFLVFYTHYIAGLVLVIQFCFILVFFHRRIRDLLIMLIIPCALVALRFTKKQYYVLFASHEMSKEKQNVPLSSLNELLITLDQLFFSRYLFAVYLASLVYAIYSLRRNKVPNFQFKLLLFLFPLLSVAILYLLGKVTNVFGMRYLLFVVPIWIVSLMMFTERKTITVAFTLIFGLLFASKIEFGGSKKMDYRLAAQIVKDIQSRQECSVLVQTHDVIPVFSYYFDRKLITEKASKDRNRLARYNLGYFDDPLELTKAKLLPTVIILQTYHTPLDIVLLDSLFPPQEYYRFTTNSIEGVRFTYLKRRLSHLVGPKSV